MACLDYVWRGKDGHTISELIYKTEMNCQLCKLVLDILCRLYNLTTILFIYLSGEHDYIKRQMQETDRYKFVLTN